jgi:hypothetical protein
MTPVPRPIAYALIGGLSADSIVQHPEARTVFPEVKLIDFDSATRAALAELHPSRIERVWESTGRLTALKHEGFIILHQRVVRDDIPYSTDMAGFHPAPRITPLKNWQVESGDLQRFLLHRPRAFGDEWLEYTVGQTGNLTYFFAPRGLGGFLYWYLLYPFRAFSFRALMHDISKRAPKA